jgi:hypothetical protein
VEDRVHRSIGRSVEACSTELGCHHGRSRGGVGEGQLRKPTPHAGVPSVFAGTPSHRSAKRFRGHSERRPRGLRSFQGECARACGGVH